jgi:hypothetical protein
MELSLRPLTPTTDPHLATARFDVDGLFRGHLAYIGESHGRWHVITSRTDGSLSAPYGDYDSADAALVALDAAMAEGSNVIALQDFDAVATPEPEGVFTVRRWDARERSLVPIAYYEDRYDMARLHELLDALRGTADTYVKESDTGLRYVPKQARPNLAPV